MESGDSIGDRSLIMKKTAITALIFILILIAGCSRTDPTEDVSQTTDEIVEDEVLPTYTKLPPTATVQLLPTNTPIPPSETPVSPTRTPLPLADTPVPEMINPGPGDVRILLLLPKGLGANYYLNEDNFELFGWHITRVGVSEEVSPCSDAQGYYGMPGIRVDELLSDIDDINAYHALAIMPAKKDSPDPYGDLMNSPEALDLVRGAVDNGLAVYGTCAGVSVLGSAGVLDGVEVTGSPSFQDEFEAAGAVYVGTKILPVIDDNIITTSRGLYFNRENCEAVARALENSMPGGEDIIREIDVETEVNSIDEKKTSWTKTFGGISADGGRDVIETSDGDFIIAGYTFSFGKGNSDAYLIKTDSEGGIEWSNAYGGPGWEYAYSVSETPDGGYVITGYTTSIGSGSRDVYLIKTDADGNEIWSRAFGGPDLDVGTSVDDTLDGGYIVAGYTESYGAGKNDIYLVKVDADGNEVWSKTFGGPEAEMGMSVRATNDGGYIVSGSTGSFGLSNRNVYVVKTNESGVEVWSNNYGVIEGAVPYDVGNTIRETSDGGYIIAGSNTASDTLGVGELMNIFLVKLDEQGDEVWTTKAGRSSFYDYGNDVYEDIDGGYVVVGATKSRSDNNEVYLVKIDVDGNVLWKKSFGDYGSDWGSAISVTADGDYVIVGHTSSFGAGSFDVWLVKVPGE
jgi:putative intracellular protease/amidase